MCLPLSDEYKQRAGKFRTEHPFLIRNAEYDNSVLFHSDYEPGSNRLPHYFMDVWPRFISELEKEDNFSAREIDIFKNLGISPSSSAEYRQLAYVLNRNMNFVGQKLDCNSISTCYINNKENLVKQDRKGIIAPIVVFINERFGYGHKKSISICINDLTKEPTMDTRSWKIHLENAKEHSLVAMSAYPEPVNIPSNAIGQKYAEFDTKKKFFVLNQPS